jgi:hypothetical protein
MNNEHTYERLSTAEKFMSGFSLGGRKEEGGGGEQNGKVKVSHIQTDIRRGDEEEERIFIFFFKSFDRRNCNCYGLIVPKSKR